MNKKRVAELIALSILILMLIGCTVQENVKEKNKEEQL